MKILINLTGIMGHDSQEVYATSLLESLLPTLESHTVYVVLSKDFPMNVFGSNKAILFSVSFLRNKFFSLFFMQCIMPLYSFFLGIDVIYSPTILFPLACASRSFPTLHDLDYLHEESSTNRFVKKYMQAMYRLAVRKSKKCFVISQAVASEASKKYNVSLAQFIIVHNSLPVALENNFRYTPLPKVPYFLYVGIYRKRKNIELLIKAFATMSNEIQETLVLAGSVRNHQSKLLELARSLQCEERIIFTGYISESYKKELYQHATAVILPSSYEGFGFPILEAQANKVPIILSDIPVFHEVAGDGALFFNSNDEKSLAKKINEIITDNNLRNTIINKGSENIKRFSWSQTAQQIANIITTP